MSSAKKSKTGGAIAWMAQNPVAANLAMLVIAAAGAFAVFSIKQEVFPEFSVGMVVVSVPYPGASPEEVEQGVVLAVEEELTGIDGVKRVNSSSSEGVGTVYVELQTDADENVVLADITSAVERITTFPEEAEEPTVALASTRMQVIALIISGDQEIRTLHDIAERARTDLLQRDEITQVDIRGVPELEVAVEVPREQLEALGLTLDDVARQIQASSIELPGGGLDTDGGEILVRVNDRRRWGHELDDIVLRGTADGARVRLGDVATITDGYADTDQESYFNGEPAVQLMVYRVGEETPTSVASAVREYADGLRSELPEAVSVTVWADQSEILADRISLLGQNAWMGFLLVLLILGLFLRARLAAWIALGIPISLLGAVALMPSLGLSVNMISLMAIIITLGLVVDDAIVVGENVFKLREEGLSALEAAIQGAHQMAVPVTFSVLTTIAAFSPLFFIPGVMGKIMWSIPAVVVSVLLFSLIESFFILPAHLAHSKKNDGERRGWLARLDVIPRTVGRGLTWFTENYYRRAVEATIRWRWAALATALVLLAVTAALVISGIQPYSFFPKLEEDRVTVTARLPYGAPIELTEEVRENLEAAALRAVRDVDGEAGLEGMFTRVGEGAQSHMRPPEVGSHLLTIEVSLAEDVSASAVARAWQREFEQMSGIEALSFEYAAGPSGGAAVDVQLSHSDQEQLGQASEELTERLRGFRELTNIDNAWSAGKQQLDYNLRPEANDLGLTSNEVARQLRSAFYGAEAVREQRGRNELKIMVRLPEEQRQSERDLDQLQIRTPAGDFVPLEQVVTVERSTAPTIIDREDGRRIVNVSAELAPGVVSSREVLAALERDVLPELEADHPGLSIALVGEQREQSEVFGNLIRSFSLALIVVFGLLAVPLRSYTQPLVIMSVIPFGFVGAVAGHMIFAMELSLMSILGFIALSGVVINDSLLLIDASNRYREAGASAFEAIVAAATRRLRPILLTSLTTFFGLMPMMLETSIQARILIPMAISLGFGILFATLIVLLLVPSLYMVLQDLKAPFARRREGELDGELGARTHGRTQTDTDDHGVGQGALVSGPLG